MKLLVLAMMFLTSINSAIPLSFDNIARSNQDVIINENGNKVQLRQRAVKKVDNVEEANIETTNVDYDLRYLFGGEKGYRTFDINSLIPTTNDSKDTSFKFICAKPVGKNLYLYVYHLDNRNSDIVSATFKISKSKTQKQETGEFEENFINYNARFINSYGYKQRFMKFAIDNIINLENDVRCYIENCYITYKDYKTNSYSINDEFAFKNGGNDDFMYQYFKDDYVRIIDGEVDLFLTEKDSKNYGVTYQSNNEDFYYFFNSNVKIDELQQVDFQYQLIDYKVDHMPITPLNANTLMEPATMNNTSVYRGLYNQFPKWGSVDEVYSYYDVNVSNFKYGKITPGTKVSLVEKPYFLWWTQMVEYSMPNIQNCLDTSNLNSKENEGFKKFISEVQNKRTNENKSKYQWCFKVNSSIRKLIDVKKVGGWWIFGGSMHAYSQCHEVKQAMIIWLKFRTNNVDFEFNVLDIPKDTTGVYLNYIPYETLGDIILDKIVSGWNWLTSTIGNIGKNIVPFAITILAIIVFVALFPFIKSFFKLISVGINSVSNGIENRSNKKKKSKQKKKGG